MTGSPTPRLPGTPDPSAGGYRRFAPFATVWASCLAAVSVLPYLVPPPAGVASAASVLGYNNTVAHLALMVAVAISLAVLARRGPEVDAVDNGPAVTERRAAPMGRDLLELALVLAAVSLLYAPPLLSAYGPYLEDRYFLSIAHRLAAGQLPYVDFESLYGPLLLFVAEVPVWLTGFSMRGYYAALLVLELALYLVVVKISQKAAAPGIRRLLIFAVLAVLCANPFLGVSWNALRRFLPIVLLGAVARDPWSRFRVLGHGISLGLLATYSHEFAALTAVSAASMYAFLARDHGLRPAVTQVGKLAVLSCVTWFTAAYFLLDGHFAAYFESAIHGASRFALEASFPFYPTLHSVATFGLFALFAVRIGRDWNRRVADTFGDRFTFAAFVYAALAFKSGLNRCDVWHLASPMLGLVLACLVRPELRRFSASRPERRVALGLVGVMAFTQAAALLPPASFVLRGWLHAVADHASSDAAVRHPPLISRGPTLEDERHETDPSVRALAAYLADPVRQDRPVIFYGRLWGLDARVGVVKTSYPTDDFLRSDEDGLTVRTFLEEHANALVLIDAGAYARLEHPGVDMPALLPPSPTKDVLSWLSTVEYLGAELEYATKEQRWGRTVGPLLVERGRELTRFDTFVVLELAPRRSSP